MSNKLIRRALIASGLFIGATAAFSPTAFAAPTATVNMSGGILTQATITASATGAAVALPLGGAGIALTDQVVYVADLAMSTNNATGLNISLSGGNLTKTGGTAIPYQVAVIDNSGDGALATYAATITNQSVSSDTIAVDKDLYIKYSAPAINDPGTYVGSILLTVADN